MKAEALRKEVEARERTISRLRGEAEYNARAFDAVAVTLNHVVNTVSVRFDYIFGGVLKGGPQVA